MDFEQIKTFLRVIDTGSFIAAAAKLGVTQSTVSARIKELELDLAQTLFERHKSGVTLTQQGRRFLPHAQAMSKTLRLARQDVANPSQVDAVIAFGAQTGQWATLLTEWVSEFRATHPGIGLRGCIETTESLLHRLNDGSLDFVVVNAPVARSGFKIEKIYEEDLVLLSPQSGHGGVTESDYVLVDWGADFMAWHAEQFPSFSGAGVQVNIGALGLWLVRKVGGAAYLPRSYLKPGVAEIDLFPIVDAPIFRESLYLISGKIVDHPALETALESLRAKALAMYAPRAVAAA